MEWMVLEDYDLYWYVYYYDCELLVLCVVFYDDVKMWFYISLIIGDILGCMDGSWCSYCWLFNVLYSFDFWLLLMYWLVWDIVVWLLLIFGIIVLVSGVVIGWCYLWC